METPPPTRKRFSLSDSEVRFRHNSDKDERDRLEEMNQRISSEIEELERSAQSLRLQREGIMSEGFAARRNKKPVFSEREPRGGERDVKDEPKRQGASADDSGDDDEVNEKVVSNTSTATERSRDRTTSSAVSHTNSSTRVTTRKVRKLMMPKDYDGTTLLSLFLNQFDSCADYNEWDNRDKAAYLRNALKGNAAHVLEDGSGTNTSYKELRVRDKDPDSLDHAFQLTMTAEANAKIYDSSDQRGYEDDRKRQRGYNEKGDADHVRGVQATEKEVGGSKLDRLCELMETLLVRSSPPPTNHNVGPPPNLTYAYPVNEQRVQTMNMAAETS